MGKASCSFDGAWPVVELQRDLSRNGAAVVPVCGRTCITRGLPVASESLVVQNRDQGCATSALGTIDPPVLSKSDPGILT